jgi:predicted nuclease of predicted toxin-antitoxin system
MRLLASENFPRVAVEALRSAGHDVLWVRLEAPGATDERVLELARAESRVLLTFDKDFGELVLRGGRSASPGVVLFRLPLARPDELAHLIVATPGARGDWAATSASSRRAGCG